MCMYTVTLINQARSQRLIWFESRPGRSRRLCPRARHLTIIASSFRMGRKAVGPVCCAMHVKERRALIAKEKGLAPVFLDLRLEHPAGWICARYKSSVLLLLLLLISQCCSEDYHVQEPDGTPRPGCLRLRPNGMRQSLRLLCPRPRPSDLKYSTTLENRI